MSTSQSKTNLNPCATEFVPSFARQVNTTNGGNSNMSSGGYNQYNQRNYNHNNHHHHQSHNHQNNRSNNYNNNNNYRNHHNNNNHYNNNNNNNNFNSYYNPNDVDPIEIEARCEAVIEILQDDNIRDQLNPVSQYEAPSNQSNPNYYYNNNNNNNTNRNFNNNNNNSNNIIHNNNNNNNDDEPGFEDEEEMLEMMAMQEECRLEMMKFYIQSQNPSLFEEIYHDVSYPDAVKKPEESVPKPVVVDVANEANNQEETTPTNETNKSSTNDTQQPSVEENTTELKDLIINHLNPDAYEFIPNKFSNLNLNDDDESTQETKKD